MSDHEAAASEDSEKPKEASSAPRTPPPKHSCGFFDPRLKARRAILLKTVGVGLVLSVIAILSLLSIYWGALYSVNNETGGLTGCVVDLDGGQIGELVTGAFLNRSGLPSQLTWTSRDYANDAQVREAVIEQACWVAVVANAGATTNLSAALANPSTSYSGQTAITVYLNQARNQQALPFIQNAYLPVLATLTSTFAAQQAKSLATSTSLSTLLGENPTLLTQPIYYTVNDLLPFDVPVALATTFVGLIYVTIFSFTFTLQGFVGRQPIQPFLSLKSLLVLRIVLPTCGYFVLALAYATLNRAFQIPFDRKFGSAGFVIFWMLCWVAMLALGFALECVITILTSRFISYFLLLWIVAQVAVALYPIELLPNIYRYGYAAPFYNFSEATRTIIFATKNKVGQNFGILIAWTVLSICTTCLVTMWQFRREERALHAEQGKSGA